MWRWQGMVSRAKPKIYRLTSPVVPAVRVTVEPSAYTAVAKIRPRTYMKKRTVRLRSAVRLMGISFRFSGSPFSVEKHADSA